MAAPEKAKMFIFAYTVNDYEKTAAFYKEALGVEFPDGTGPLRSIGSTSKKGSSAREMPRWNSFSWRNGEGLIAVTHLGTSVFK